MDLFKWTKNLTFKFPDVAEKLFGQKIDEWASSTEAIATIPSVNITGSKKAFKVDVAVPGIGKKDIKLEVRDHNLIISSENQYEKENNEEHWMRREYGYASFQRMFQLPENADPEQIDASMKNGVLKITLGKRKEKETQPTTVEVK